MRRPDAIVHGVGRIVRNRRPSGLQPQDRYPQALASECRDRVEAIRVGRITRGEGAALVDFQGARAGKRTT
jgi:hypothetical protein